LFKNKLFKTNFDLDFKVLQSLKRKISKIIFPLSSLVMSSLETPRQQQQSESQPIAYNNYYSVVACTGGHS